MEAVLNSLAPQTIHPVTDSSGIAAVRRAGNTLAGTLGFNETMAGKAALVITEAATNVLKHAGSGDILLRPLERAGSHGMEILAIDNGPGFANLDLAMRDGMSTAGSYGVGLGAMQRVADEFDLYTDRNHGTVLRMAVWPTAAPVTLWTVGAVCLPLPSEHACGDAWGSACRNAELLLMVADGLGHGPEAARASQAAVALVDAQASFAPEALVQDAHAALRGTRGAALAVACLNLAEGTLRFAGIGNISVSVHAASTSRHLVSHNGIVGSNMRKVQEFQMDFGDDDILIMHSDGLATRWDLERYPGLLRHHPSLIAAVLYRDYARHRDDVSVVVAQRNRE
ncbi:SpoIIE family protein phosphatase|nr:SpoIIE family protein phosphatase [Noviherbaspirillum sp. L7-7A]